MALAQYFDFDEMQTQIVTEYNADIAIEVSNLFTRLRHGDIEVLRALILVMGILQFDKLTMYWLDSVNHNIDISTILQGVDILSNRRVNRHTGIHLNGANEIGRSFFVFNPDGYRLPSTVGSQQHKLLTSLIQRRLITNDDIEGIIAANNIPEEFANLLRGQVQKRNVLRNIPGAAANKTARRILKEKLSMTNRLGPIHTISQMVGAPATVRRARKTRRNK